MFTQLESQAAGIIPAVKKRIAPLAHRTAESVRQSAVMVSAKHLKLVLHVLGIAGHAVIIPTPLISTKEDQVIRGETSQVSPLVQN